MFIKEHGGQENGAGSEEHIIGVLSWSPRTHITSISIAGRSMRASWRAAVDSSVRAGAPEHRSARSLS